MSEKPKTEVEKPKEGADIIEENVAILQYQIKALTDALDALTTEHDGLKKKYVQAKDFIEQQSKVSLISDIKSKTTMPEHLLAQMSVEKLKETKNILDASVAPVFKSGTPMGDTKKKPSLDGMFESYAQSTWRKG